METQTNLAGEYATLQMRYGLTPLLVRILHLLAKNNLVTADMIEVQHQLTNDTPVAIHRLRKRMAPFDVKVNYRRGVGYWIETRDRDAIIANMVPDQLDLPLDGGGMKGSNPL